MSKFTLPPIRFFIGDKQVTEKEVIAHLNKKQCPAATEQKKIS